jgi:hypothetical protein
LSCGRKRSAKVTGLKQKNREKVGFYPGMYAMFVNLNNGFNLFFLAASPTWAPAGHRATRLLSKFVAIRGACFPIIPESQQG